MVDKAGILRGGNPVALRAARLCSLLFANKGCSSGSNSDHAGGLILRSAFSIRLIWKKRPTVVRLVSQGP
jgi:hypothetical protein